MVPRYKQWIRKPKQSPPRPEVPLPDLDQYLDAVELYTEKNPDSACYMGDAVRKGLMRSGELSPFMTGDADVEEMFNTMHLLANAAIMGRYNDVDNILMQWLYQRSTLNIMEEVGYHDWSRLLRHMRAKRNA